MNIKEHIEAGHYPTDDKGRALVPTANPNTTAVITATDCPVGDYMLGWAITYSERRQIGAKEVGGAPYRWMIAWWQPDGTNGKDKYCPDLQPPEARKVRMTRWAILDSTIGNRFVASVDSRDEAKLARGEFFVELTGEYEQPWPTNGAAADPPKVRHP